GVHREDRLSHPGRTDAVNPVLVNRYQKTSYLFLYNNGDKIYVRLICFVSGKNVFIGSCVRL
uniref:hypothetical protein n=1 Tax=Aeromonas sp. QDB30 TaxID=2989831 RepID=UPI0022DF1378